MLSNEDKNEIIEMLRCPACKGTTYSIMEEFENGFNYSVDCQNCNGTGIRLPEKGCENNTLADCILCHNGDTCLESLKSSMNKEEKNCENCNGTGIILPENVEEKQLKEQSEDLTEIKLSKEDFTAALAEIDAQVEVSLLEQFMKAKNIEDLQKNFLTLAQGESLQEFETIVFALRELGYGEEIEFSGSLIRGFDYYDGMIFEMFDTNKENPRALFGGGRYNGLAGIF